VLAYTTPSWIETLDHTIAPFSIESGPPVVQ
jgi:hypothetical protein